MKEENSKKGNKKFIILGTILTLILVIVGYLWISSIGHEKTDNAQLDTMITPVRNIVQGFVTKLNFEENQAVKKGQILLEIDETEYLAKVAQAEAALESALAQLEITKSGIISADVNANASDFSSKASKENIRIAEARFIKTEKDLARMEKMFKENAATLQSLEAIRADYQAAKAQLEMVKKQYEASVSAATGASASANSQKKQVSLANAMIKQRKAELILAQTQLANTKIKAPFDGVISKKSVEVGQYIQAGIPICSAVDLNNIWISANFKETQIGEMKKGQVVAIKIDAFPTYKITGKIESIGGATGAKFSLLPPDNSTGNFVKITQRVAVRIKLNQLPAILNGLLIPGLSAIVDVHTK
jgi:membrane fusion protein (multidrug efflux system)